MFPADNAIYKKGQIINFISKSDCAIKWYDKDGNILSEESSFSTDAKDEITIITLQKGNNILDKITLRIEENTSTIFTLNSDIGFMPGENNLGHFISFGPELMECSISTSTNRELRSSIIKENALLKDINLEFNSRAKPLINPYISRTLETEFLNYSVGDSKEFFVADIDGSNGGVAYIKSFILLCSDSNVYYWLDKNNTTTSEETLSIVTKISNTYYTRVIDIWGNLLDIDSDGKMNILFSKNLNDSNMAIGFFNPNDLYENNTNIMSDYYNPYSNEGEILYLGIPESDRFAFSEESLLATTVHEISHLINFQQKTYTEYLKGNNDPQKMESFLDEGLAHLTETLCGLGISGGNIGFYAKYLSDPGIISLVGNNNLGQSDSTGKRGAVSGFLSWLFWSKGGFSFDSNNKIIDYGGILYLRELVLNNSSGWNAIGNVYGISTNLLFEQWVNNLIIEDEYIGLYDNITAEPLFLDPYMGTLNISDEISIKIDGVNKSLLLTEEIKILPYSFFPWSVGYNTTMIGIDNITGDSFVKVLTY